MGAVSLKCYVNLSSRFLTLYYWAISSLLKYIRSIQEREYFICTLWALSGRTFFIRAFVLSLLLHLILTSSISFATL
jgi:hypothetical protein